MKSVSMKQRLAGKKSLKKQWMQKESVSKQERKSAKAEPSVHKDPLFDELPDDTLNYMDTEDAQDVGRTRDVVNEEKESAEDAVSTEGVVSADKEKVSTDRQNVSTDRPNVSTDRPKVNTDKEKGSIVSPDEGTDDQTEGRSATPTTPTTTPIMFRDDETIAQFSYHMSQAKQLAKDEEMARKVQDDWEAEEEVKKLAEEEAIKTALSNEYDFIQARIEADRLLALRLQDEEREQFTMEERAKFLHDTIKSLKKRVVEETPKKEDTTKVPAKVDVTEQGTKKRKGGHIKMIARKRKRPQPDVNSDDEHRKCLKIVTFEGTMDSEIMERKSVIARLDKVSSPDGDYLVIYRANGNFRAFNYLLEIMMESSQEENDQSDFWDDQQDWEIVTWRLYEACGVYILELKDGTVIHMLVEKRYPLSKDLLQRMLDLGLEVERESTAALDLIRFIKQQIDEN
ncbi:hypothetical protein Tco_1540978 [Tanacetum coccineum]